MIKKISLSVMFVILILMMSCSRDLSVKNSQALTSQEIIKVLKYESIEAVSATHSNKIVIYLKSGTIYKGVYNPHDIPEYAKNQKLHPAGNLVSHIRNRFNKKWTFERE